jgi:hypothetical protein
LRTMFGYALLVRDGFEVVVRSKAEINTPAV